MTPTEQYPHYIEFRHVYKTFDKPVLVDSNFHVDAGADRGDHRAQRRRQVRHPVAHHGFPEARQRPRDRGA